MGQLLHPKSLEQDARRKNAFRSAATLDYLFQALDAHAIGRKQSSAMILASNRDVSEWAEVFPDPVIANATVDQIFDRAKTVLFKGQSYRLKGRIQARELKAIDAEAPTH